MSKETDELKKQCEDLIAAFHFKMSFPEGDHRRNGPVTPNDPATISTLASHLLSRLRTDPKPKTCQWKLLTSREYDGCTISVGCRKKLLDLVQLSIAESEYVLCPFCGGVIKEIEHE